MILVNMEICCKNVANIKNFANGAVAKNISISKIATVLLNRAGRKYIEEKLSYTYHFVNAILVSRENPRKPKFV